MKRKLRRLYRKYWNVALPFVLGWVGITPVQYQTGKKVWKSKPVRKTRKRTEKLIKKSLRYVFVVGLVYYFIQNPEDFKLMINHFIVNLTGLIGKGFALITDVFNA